MQTYTINFDTQASYILPLLDDLKIDYAPKDFIEQIEQDAKLYESGKLPPNPSQNMKKKCANLRRI